MSSSTAPKNEYLCIIPDLPGAMAKRLEVRPKHFEGLKPLIANGSIVAGGATFESHVSEGETPTFNGSAVIFVAESAEAVRSLLAEDVYTKSGVWDLDNARIIPYKSAVRMPM